METCRAHVHKNFPKQAQQFESFEKGCLSQDSLALVEYAIDLKAQGCTIDLIGKHRRLQKGAPAFLTLMLTSKSKTCSWNEITAYGTPLSPPTFPFFRLPSPLLPSPCHSSFSLFLRLVPSYSVNKMFVGSLARQPRTSTRSVAVARPSASTVKHLQPAPPAAPSLSSSSGATASTRSTSSCPLPTANLTRAAATSWTSARHALARSTRNFFSTLS